MNEIDKSVHCYKCFQKLEFESGEKILRHEECPQCKVSLRCCKMCHFYDIQVYNECREPLAERTLEKESANFCSYFVLADGGSKKGQEKNNLLAKANSLFKD
ncbi:MAG: hypothetical protein A2X86_05910 [Bdellovibrionales bacterium GWA2_49_15]|nr:MAG: hypothetical protein A2X86_05910 [Bdellovibrionales bacterium GWA2_49_15]